jgi:hypothetical protein
LQAEPIACAIRGHNDIKVFKLPGEADGKELEAKISMFADDTQLFNKDERSVEKSFVILSTPKVFTFSLIHDILLNFGFLLRAVQIEIAFVLL